MKITFQMLSLTTLTCFFTNVYAQQLISTPLYAHPHHTLELNWHLPSNLYPSPNQAVAGCPGSGPGQGTLCSTYPYDPLVGKPIQAILDFEDKVKKQKAQINNQGHVLSNAKFPTDNNDIYTNNARRVYRWEKDGKGNYVAQDIGSFAYRSNNGASENGAGGMNNSGHVVGRSLVAYDCKDPNAVLGSSHHGALWTGTALSTFYTPNAEQQFVKEDKCAQGPFSPPTSGQAITLNNQKGGDTRTSLIDITPYNTVWDMGEARTSHINDNGMIVGTTNNPAGAAAAIAPFKWVPIDLGAPENGGNLSLLSCTHGASQAPIDPSGILNLSSCDEPNFYNFEEMRSSESGAIIGVGTDHYWKPDGTLYSYNSEDAPNFDFILNDINATGGVAMTLEMTLVTQNGPETFTHPVRSRLASEGNSYPYILKSGHPIWGDNSTYATAEFVNDQEQIAGVVRNPADQKYHIYLWERSTGMQNLGAVDSVCGTEHPRLMGLSENGEVIGDMGDEGNCVFIASINNGQPSITRVPGMTTISDINDNHQIVGLDDSGKLSVRSHPTSSYDLCHSELDTSYSYLDEVIINRNGKSNHFVTGNNDGYFGILDATQESIVSGVFYLSAKPNYTQFNFPLSTTVLIDRNRNGIFEPSEKLTPYVDYGAPTQQGDAHTMVFLEFGFQGEYIMRVIQKYLANVSSGCSFGAWGEYEDYKIKFQ